MRRRDFASTIAAGSLWSLAARAQQGERMRRIGVLQGASDRGPNFDVFLQTLEQLGWAEGRNVRIDSRWPAGDADKARKYAAELVALAPDVILAVSATNVPPLLQATQSVPIVFVAVADPVGAGFVKSLSRPGGNATGFMLFEYGLTAKWLDLLKEVAPSITQASVLRDPTITSGIGQFAVMQYVAPSVGMDVSPVDVRDTRAIEPALMAIARSGNGGLIVSANPLSLVNRELIVTLAARHKLPTVYWERVFVTGGGLISYGPNVTDQFRRGAGYVDRILKGERLADLPVQAPTNYELVINLKTAKALGISIRDRILARADEVIE